VICADDLTGATPRTYKLKATASKPKPKCVLFEDKCKRCSIKNRSCDGETPCQKCIIDGVGEKCILMKEVLRRRSEFDSGKCNTCITKNLRCDEGRPCRQCKATGKNCHYEDQDGLVTRGYQVPGAPPLFQRKQLADDDSSDDGCTRCPEDGRECHGGRPCRWCVRKGVMKNLVHCTFRKKGGVMESYTIHTHTLNDDGEVVLKPD
jgi:hypothetical protein